MKLAANIPIGKYSWREAGLHFMTGLFNALDSREQLFGAGL